jgi:hypothetical protein
MMDDRTRIMLLAMRAALIQLLGAIEDCLSMPRTLPSRAERRNARVTYPRIDP